MSTVQQTWVGCKQLFLTAHHELRETIYLTIQGVGIYHTNMVHDVVAGLQEVLHQEQTLNETPTVILEPNKHVKNAVQNTQHKLTAKLHQIHTMMHTLQLRYDA